MSPDRAADPHARRTRANTAIFEYRHSASGMSTRWTRRSWAPLETAAVVRAAIDRMVQDDTVPADEPWRALEVLAAPVTPAATRS